MPTLYILAGPNGTGKTTYYNTAIEQGYIALSLSFINADNICRDELGGYSIQNAATAEIIVRERIKGHIDKQADFMIESNLSVQTDFDWIDTMKKNGYDISLYFLCTEFVEINISRVQNRVIEGGHDIPEAIIRQRYDNVLMYLKGKLHTFSEAVLIDNSTDTPVHIASLKQGKIIFKSDQCPSWAKQLLFISEKLEVRQIR